MRSGKRYIEDVCDFVATVRIHTGSKAQRCQSQTGFTHEGLPVVIAIDVTPNAVEQLSATHHGHDAEWIDAVVAWVKVHRALIAQHNIGVDGSVQVGDVGLSPQLLPPGRGALRVVGTLASWVGAGLIAIAINIHVCQLVAGTLEVDRLALTRGMLAVAPALFTVVVRIEALCEQCICATKTICIAHGVIEALQI